jgi:hypothetical protein
MKNNGIRRLVVACGFVVTCALIVDSVRDPLHAQGGLILVQENFEDTSFASRGWYDGNGGALSTVEKFDGNGSFECRFSAGGTGCVGGTPRRHLFTPSQSVYVSYYVKHSTNWVGSGRSYHPHLFQLITDVDSAYIGPAYTHLTGYIEAVGGVPHLAIQDGRNIDETRVGQDLTAVTEQRSVAGCNGDSDGYGNGDCYAAGAGVHWNGKVWTPGQIYFDGTPGSPRYKGDWHLVEAYFRLNSIVNGKGAKDGVLKYWYDGQLILDRSDVVLRTGAHPTMRFNQFLIAPYIGDGSPVSQTFWIDDLVIATARPDVPPTPPSGSASALPAAPTNLRIIS